MFRTCVRSVIGWLCVMGVGVAFLAPGQQTTAAEKKTAARGAAGKLIGTWKLVAIEERDADGKLTVPLDYGSDPVGMLMYDATGHMSAQAMRRGRAKLPSDDVHLATPEQAKAAFTGYNGYFGTYEVIESESIVIHHVEGSMIPNWEGGDQRRKFTISGDKLILEPPPIQAGGAKRVRRLTWLRVH